VKQLETTQWVGRETGDLTVNQYYKRSHCHEENLGYFHFKVAFCCFKWFLFVFSRQKSILKTLLHHSLNSRYYNPGWNNAKGHCFLLHLAIVSSAEVNKYDCKQQLDWLFIVASIWLVRNRYIAGPTNQSTREGKHSPTCWLQGVF